jgi:uncharacterized protein YdaU (DUF1376 family)
VELEEGDVIQNKRLSEEIKKMQKIRAKKQHAARVKWRKNKETNCAGAYAHADASHSHRYRFTEEENYKEED